ncbi:hypothetical protein LRP88_08290 [Fusarium phalaenopsidis]
MSPPEQSETSSSQLVPDETLPSKPDVEVTSAKHPAAGETDTRERDRDASFEHAPKSNSGPEGDLIDFQDQPSSISLQGENAAAGEPQSEVARGKQVAGHQRTGSDALNAQSSSLATVKPMILPSSNDTATQYLTAEPSTYVDPTPATPTTSQPPSRTPSNATRSLHPGEISPSKSDAEYDERRYLSEDEQEGRSRSEIQSIMEQFSEVGGGPGEEEVMSPRLEIASPMLGHPVQHPPRKSSLEPLAPSISGQLQGLHISTSSPPAAGSVDAGIDDHGPPVPPKDGIHGTPPRPKPERTASVATPSSPAQAHRPPPPEPEPEPVLPFDFHRFLEQLRNKKADPVARYLKSFLSEFAKRQWMVHEQVKIIGDFLAFIANKMALCEVWRDVSDAEFDNAREGMEKLVMNRLYTQTFSPAIMPPKPIPGAKPKRKGGDIPLGPGRRGQHQEDVERDDIVTQKINIYGWVKEEHLDIPPVGESGRRFLKLAQTTQNQVVQSTTRQDHLRPELLQGDLWSIETQQVGFIGRLLHAPAHLRRFAKPGEAWRRSRLLLPQMGAIQFIENMDRTTLTITDDEFERHVEAAVSAIAEKHAASPPATQQPVFNEKSVPPGEPASRQSLDGQNTPAPRRSTSNDGYTGDDKAAITGLLKTIQRPLSTIGRMFSDEPVATSEPGPSSAPRTPAPPEQLRQSREEPREPPHPASRHELSAEEAAARQASAEAAEAQRLSRAEHANVVETLAGMFPDLDKEVISDVVYEKEGRVGLAVDACLALST